MNALILNQILSTILKKKCMEISLENLYVDLLGLKGLIVHTYTVQTLLGTCEECEIGFLLGYSFM